jgi:hypothetical protein
METLVAILWRMHALGDAHSCVNGASSCNRLFRDHNGHFVKGFFGKVSSNSSLYA